jgi:hypothetical protein
MGPIDTFIPMNTETTFTCVINSELNSVVDITWEGPDPVLPPPVNNNDNGIITSNLTINVTDGIFEGQGYNCTVLYRSCLLTVTSTSATFFIILLPTIVQAPMSGAFNTDDSMTLTCSATTNYGSLSITWTGPTTNLQGIDVSSTENNITNSLNISLLNSTIGGVYTCIATNEAGSITASATIFVRPIIMPTVILASNGDEISLICEVQTFPPSFIQWRKQNIIGDFEVLPDASGNNLTIAPVVFGDEGVYSCSANSKEFGVQHSSITALIAGNLGVRI